MAILKTRIIIVFELQNSSLAVRKNRICLPISGRCCRGLESAKMIILIYGMFAITILVVVAAFVALAKWKSPPAGAGSNEVFEVSGNLLTVFAGSHVTYNIDDIQKIVFSTFRGRHGSSHAGIMRVVKKNGKKSRPFMFYGNAKNFALASTEQEIEKKHWS